MEFGEEQGPPNAPESTSWGGGRPKGAPRARLLNGHGPFGTFRCLKPPPKSILARRKWVLCLQMNFDLANGFSQRKPPFGIAEGPSQEFKNVSVVVELRNCFALKLIYGEQNHFASEQPIPVRGIALEAPPRGTMLPVAPIRCHLRLPEWARAPRCLPPCENPAKTNFSMQKKGFVFANEF